MFMNLHAAKWNYMKVILLIRKLLIPVFYPRCQICWM